MKEALNNFLSALVVTIIIVVTRGLIFCWLWGLVIPKIFPGFIEGGYIVENITLMQALLVSWFIDLLTLRNYKKEK